MSSNFEYNCKICKDSKLCTVCDGKGFFEIDMGNKLIGEINCINCNDGYCLACKK